MATSPTMKARNHLADLLKGLAVIAMIQVHATEQFALPHVYQSLAGKISLFLGGPFCAPVFLAVMGYFLVSGSKPGTAYLKRGLLLFFGGLLLNLGRSFNLVLHILRGELQLDPLFYLFGADILTLAGLSVLIIALLRKFLPSKPGIYFLLALCFAAANSFLPFPEPSENSWKYLTGFFWGNAAFSYFPLFPWFAYVLLGYCFRLLPEDFLIRFAEAGKQKLFLFLLFADVILTLPWPFSVTCDLPAYYHHGLSFFLWMLLFLSAWPLIMTRIAGKNNVLTRFLEWTGREVTAIYVIQWLITGNLSTEIYQTQSLAASVLLFAALTLASCLLALAFKGFLRYMSRPQV